MSEPADILSRREEKRRRILEAADGCFARRGFHATSMAEICEAAGMSAGNLYRYFPSKEAMIAALVDAEREETAALFRRVEDSDDPLAAVTALLERFLTLTTDAAGHRLWLEILSEGARNPQIQAVLDRSDAEVRPALAHLVGRAATLGQADPAIDGDQAAIWLLMLIDGFSARVATDPGFDIAAGIAALPGMVRRFLGPGA
ncbi:TetR/AcrR family transcriptional regulator [Mycobacterium sp. KBS0706]|uniref:TetR/AcrR family transcriptional regulator n=1 Tax=Mycobacterium sp. KBS0706 TaxID=2578109 RepID=UPI00110F85D8|nr:TetR/AcrR family transcriptional regulator [Mycobacterium sp. KBS0706]TSD84582.1 TetR/AcrR family transcriptional regulator [Mycobacterium sp. KBS0706]